MNYYPPVSFYFRVVFVGVTDAGQGTPDSNFQEVSGLTAELEVQKIQEGGVNGYQHSLPSPTKYPNLVLKRGLLTSSKLVEWITKAIEQFIIEPKDIEVTLMNPEGKPLVSWNIVGAWPIKWETSGFNANDNSVVTESIELTYQKFTRSVPS